MSASDPLPTIGVAAESVATEGAAGVPAWCWPAILATHDAWLRRVVAARLRERHAVDEVMQEVALAAVAQQAPLLHPRRVVGWLYKLAVRQVLLYRRKTGRQRALVERYARRRDLGDETPEHSPLAWLMRDERRALVQQALRRLPPRDADLLILKYAEGWSARALAERLGMQTAAIEARLHRARGRLRAELAVLSTEFVNETENSHET